MALRLKGLGITGVRPLLGGLPRWVELGYPIDAPLVEERMLDV